MAGFLFPLCRPSISPIFLSRQLPPLNVAGKLVGEGSADLQIEQVLTNLEAVLQECGSSLEELVRLNVSADSHCEGLPCYVDSVSPDVPGSSAGDALWKTYQTMQVFD